MFKQEVQHTKCDKNFFFYFWNERLATEEELCLYDITFFFLCAIMVYMKTHINDEPAF